MKRTITLNGIDIELEISSSMDLSEFDIQLIEKKSKVKNVKFANKHILWPNEDGSNLGYSFIVESEYGNLPIDQLDSAGKYLAKKLKKYFKKK